MKVCIALAAALLAAGSVANAAVTTYAMPLGPEAVGATGTGSATIKYDNLAHTLDIAASFSGLPGLTTVAHIHCCVATAGAGTAGVAVMLPTLPGFPADVTAGSYGPVSIDLGLDSSYSGGFLTASGGTASDAERALIDGINAGKAYLNIHTSPTFGRGEIRGFLAPIPEPATYALMLVGLLGVGAAARRGSY